MRKTHYRKYAISALVSALTLLLLSGCGSVSGSDSSADTGKANGYRNASFTLETEESEGEEVTFNGITFEVPDTWRAAEDGGDALYYTTDADTDVIRVHADSAAQEYGSQQELVNAVYADIMKERIDAGCYIESYDLNVAGHRGKWFRSDVNFIAEDGTPVAGYERDTAMDGYVRECVLFAANKKDYVLLEAIYPMGSMTENEFQIFYKSPHYHR